MARESIAEKVTTGVGEVEGYVCVVEPSTKFNAEGEYSINILVSEKEAKALIKKIEAIVERQYERYRKNSKKVEITAVKPYVKVEKDENGRIIKETPDPEGRYIIKAKNKAYIKNGVVGQKIQIFDSKLNPMTGVKFGAGSKVRLGLTLEGYSTNLGTGVSVKLRMVQVLEMASFGGYKADDFFTETEGYEFDGDSAETVDINDEEADF